METRSNPTVQAFLPPPDTRLISLPRFCSKLFAFFCIIILALSLVTAYTRQRALFPSRPSTKYPRSRVVSTQFLGRNAKDDRFPLHAFVEYGRWRHDCFHGRTMVQRRVVSVSPFVQPELLGKKRTLVSRRRITAYRLRRNRGRIKLPFRRKKMIPCEQKINEKVGHVLVRYYDQNGDKTIPSTSVSNSRSLGVSILPFFHPTIGAFTYTKVLVAA